MAKWVWVVGAVGLVALAVAGWGAFKTGAAIARTRFFKQPSASMLPTIPLNTVVTVNLRAYRKAGPGFGDILAFHAPKIALNPDTKEAIFLKRCLGVAGDVIEIRKEVLYRNGKAVKEPYISAPGDHDFRLVQFKGRYVPLAISAGMANGSYSTPPTFQLSPSESDAALKLPAAAVPPGFILVMGDNRPNSADSRIWGLLAVDQVIGRVEL